MVGCFVRVGIGKNSETGKDVYRCCEVMDVCETGKVYAVMKSKTNVGLKLRHGKDSRVFRLQFVSNSPLTDNEFNKWQAACAEGNVELPTAAHVEQKIKDLQYAATYRFSSADVEKIIASKQKFNTRPKNYAMHKAKLMKERDMALTIEDHERAEKLNAQLEELESQAEELDKQRTSTISTISLINDKNRKNNIARAYAGINEDVKRKLEEGEVSDPYTRRKTKPVLSTGGKAKADGEMGDAAMKPPAPVPLKKPVIRPPELLEPKTKKNHITLPKLDIFDVHNFDLDINVDENQVIPLTPAINLKPVTASANPAGPAKRSLKLDEWKKKRGII